jgi:hypothetical protein
MVSARVPSHLPALAGVVKVLATCKEQTDNLYARPTSTPASPAAAGRPSH